MALLLLVQVRADVNRTIGSYYGLPDPPVGLVFVCLDRLRRTQPRQQKTENDRFILGKWPELSIILNFQI